MLVASTFSQYLERRLLWEKAFHPKILRLPTKRKDLLLAQIGAIGAAEIDWSKKEYMIPIKHGANYPNLRYAPNVRPSSPKVAGAGLKYPQKPIRHFVLLVNASATAFPPDSYPWAGNSFKIIEKRS
jgi:hypothetical protein